MLRNAPRRLPTLYLITCLSAITPAVAEDNSSPVIASMAALSSAITATAVEPPQSAVAETVEFCAAIDQSTAEPAVAAESSTAEPAPTSAIHDAETVAAATTTTVAVESTPQSIAPPKPPLDLATQRAHYNKSMAKLQRGASLAALKLPPAMSDYPLYAYLDMKDITNRFGRLPFADIDRFLAQHEGTMLEDRLRGQWLASLARKQRWSDYRRFYQVPAASSTHECWYLEALHHTGDTELALVSTTELWMDAGSLPHACDAPFRRWMASGMRSDPLIWQRLMLALEHSNYRLGRYLSTQLSASYREQGKLLLQVHTSPQQLSKLAPGIVDQPKASDVLAHGLKRLAKADSDLAARLWHRYRDDGQLQPQASADVRHAIARQVIAGHNEEEALAWLVRNDPNAEDSYLLEWRIRLALKQNQWPQVESWIALLPADMANTPRWRYWQARAIAQHDDPRAAEIYQQVAQERHFYGFLAADQLGAAYDFNDRPIASDDIAEPLQQLGNRPEVLRTQELLALNQELAARREWFYTLEHLPREQLPMAAQLAHNWGWHPQAIRSAIKAEYWDDLNVRFPLVYQDQVLNSAKNKQIPAEWIYGIARQESAFLPDARSSAGALGLLQMLPTTAKQVAHSSGLRYQESDLLKPEKSIDLGSTYLSQLLNQFGGNRILATAAYNAGPTRIKQVLARQQKPLDHDVWIETIPYYETRDYVQNVLSFALIYAYRMGDTGHLVLTNEIVIGPNGKPVVGDSGAERPTVAQASKITE